MDRRHAVADVSHVGRAGEARRNVLHREEVAAQRSRIALEDLGHRPVGLEVQIIHAAPVEFEPAAGGDGAGLEAGLHARLERRQFAHVGGAHEEAAGGAFRHDVRRHAAFGDDAVDALAAPDVLAQLRDRLIRGDDGVERVQPAIRHGGGVRGAAVINRFHLGDGDARHGHQVHVGRMHHHRRVGLLEGAEPRHQLLAAVTLLGGRAEHAHHAGQARAELGQRDGRAITGGGDDVVAAGMADAGQRVVFREDRDGRAVLLAELGGISGGQAEGFAAHRDAVAGESIGEARRGLEFLQRQLGFAVDRMAQTEQLVAHGIDRRNDIFFQQFQRHVRAFAARQRHHRQSRTALRWSFSQPSGART